MSGEASSINSGQLLGTVLAVQANFYRVQLDQQEEDGNPAVEVNGETVAMLRPQGFAGLPREQLPKEFPGISKVLNPKEVNYRLSKLMNPQENINFGSSFGGVSSLREVSANERKKGQGDKGMATFSSSASSASFSPNPSLLLCTRRTRLKKIGQQVIVGDRVVVEEPDWAGARGAIADVLPRHSQLDRPAIANVNQILLVFAVTDPPLEPYQLSRFLVKAESTGLDVALCLNKSDLISSQEQAKIKEYLNNWGYQPTFISVNKGINLDAIFNVLNNKITVIAGASGVGKSSLINTLIPNANLRVAEVSGKLARGRHTTRHVELFELPGGGLLADTPGFNQPDLNCTPEELASYFPEALLRLNSGKCRFTNCLHRDEPDCIVRGDWERYEYYLQFLDEAIEHQTWLKQQADPDSNLKLKTKGKGRQQYEPKLESKKYRRVSRKKQQQTLQELYQESEE